MHLLAAKGSAGHSQRRVEVFGAKVGEGTRDGCGELRHRDLGDLLDHVEHELVDARHLHVSAHHLDSAVFRHDEDRHGRERNAFDPALTSVVLDQLRDVVHDAGGQTLTLAPRDHALVELFGRESYARVLHQGFFDLVFHDYTSSGICGSG